MAFGKTNSTKLFNIRYSAFLGSMYLDNAQTSAEIDKIKAQVGEVEWKKGFTGSTGNGASAQALQALTDAGVQFGNMNGTLTGVRLIEREVQGRKTLYLSLTVTEKSEKYNLSVAINQPGVQMLIRKLANAQIGVPTAVSLFATYGQREGAPRAFADHGASLKQNGQEVKGIDPAQVLAPTIDRALTVLKEAGVDDKETLNKRRATVELNFHIDLLKSIESKFAEFYSQRDEQSRKANEAATA